MAAIELYLVRHGPVAPVPASAPACWPLTDGGRERVRRLAHEPRFSAWTHIVTSPEDKARQTAAILAEHLGIPLHVDDRLRELEMNAGFLPAEEFRRRVEAYLSGLPDPAFERRTGAIARALDAVHAHQGMGASAVVSHGRLLSLLVESLVPGVDAAKIWSRMAFPDWALVDVSRQALVRSFTGEPLA